VSGPGEWAGAPHLLIAVAAGVALAEASSVTLGLPSG
jgi:hypothetical protein